MAELIKNIGFVSVLILLLIIGCGGSGEKEKRTVTGTTATFNTNENKNENENENSNGNGEFNNKPEAIATAPKSGHVDDEIELDGKSSSDLDGDSLTYTWTFEIPENSETVLSQLNIVNPVFVPDVEGDYIFTLVVNDGKDDSEPSSVTITISTIPIAIAGNDYTVDIGETIALDGINSSTSSDVITYLWSLESKPATSVATLSNPTIVNPTLPADVEGVYKITLVVNDGVVDSSLSTISITVVTPVFFVAEIVPIIRDNCTKACHIEDRNGFSVLNLTEGTIYSNLVNKPSLKTLPDLLVAPGNSSKSVLYSRLEGVTVGLQMPKGNPSLNADDLKKIKGWIDQGAKNN